MFVNLTEISEIANFQRRITFTIALLSFRMKKTYPNKINQFLLDIFVIDEVKVMSGLFSSCSVLI